MVTRISLIAFLTFSVLTATVRAQGEARGLVVHEELSSNYPEAIEFRSFRKDNALYCTVITPDGKSRQFKNAEVLGVFDFPPLNFDPDFEAAAGPAIRKLADAAAKYPRIQTPLDIARGRWERALSVFNQQRMLADKPTSGRNRSGVISELNTKGGRYLNVRLVSISRGLANITHATGVAALPITDLTDAQAVALNTTSTKVQLAVGVETAAGGEGTATTTVSRSVSQFSGRVAPVFGLTSQSFSIWFFHVTIPLLCLVLLVSLIVQHRRDRRLLRKK